MLEIELKVRVPDLHEVRRRLTEIGARMTEKTREHDIYYNAPHRDFASTDEALRIRYSNGKTIITYKGKKRRDSQFKAREELNVGIDDGQVFEQVLERIGFRRVAVVDKEREYYVYKDASIALDLVEGLGTFVEVEIMADGIEGSDSARIDEIAKLIGLEGEHILSSYLEMIESKQ